MEHYLLTVSRAVGLQSGQARHQEQRQGLHWFLASFEVVRMALWLDGWVLGPFGHALPFRCSAKHLAWGNLEEQARPSCCRTLTLVEQEVQSRGRYWAPQVAVVFLHMVW